MLKFKKVIAGLSAVVIAMSLAACGSDITWASKIDGKVISPGTYIYFVSQGYTDASSKLTEQEIEGDVFDNKIDGQNAKDYIKDFASEKSKESVAILNEFDNLGLEFSDKKATDIEMSIESEWEQLGDTYKKLGIAESSLNYIYTMYEKQSMIFDAYYAEGGIEEVSDEEILEKLSQDYAYIRAISVSLKNDEGEDLTDDEKAEKLEKLEAYKTRIEDGEKFIDIYDEYNKELQGDSYTVSDEDLADEDRAKTVIDKNNQYLSSTLIDSIMSQENDTVEIIKVEGAYLLVEKYDITQSESVKDNYTDTIIYSLKNDEFNQKIESWASELSIEKNEAVYDKYDPKDIHNKLS